MTYVLAIGDRAYSSWSLRGWLPFAKFDIPVATRFLRLYSPELPAALAAEFGGARTVPALLVPREGAPAVPVWDSLAIAETLAERHPEERLWPEDPAARALARSIVAEMHASFSALRTACPMNLRRAYEGFALDAAVANDLARIEALWNRARAAYGGSGRWLFSRYSIADVFFAPVAARIATYGLPVDEAGAEYVAEHLADPAFRAWRAAGLADPVVQERYDRDLPETAWPGPEPLPARAVEGVASVNAACPFSGTPVQPDSLAEVKDTVIGFCNPTCRDKFVADPEAWPKAMALVAR